MKKTFTIDGTDSRPMLADIQYDEERSKSPVVIYAHGFCGFKDWGNFDLIAAKFVNAGFTFLKFNFSHNGTTPEAPEDFTDLEAFGNNNYSIEVKDLEKVICFLSVKNDFSAFIDSDKIGLIGHSMGGGIVILNASKNNKVKALATWASIAKCSTPWTNWTDEQINNWKEEGVAYYHNGRTKQDLPLYFQLHEDMEKHEQELNIIEAAKKLTIPLLICHGTEDSSVPMSAAEAIQKASGGKLFIVHSDHVFGRKHPWESEDLPGATEEVVQKTIAFFS